VNDDIQDHDDPLRDYAAHLDDAATQMPDPCRTRVLQLAALLIRVGIQEIHAMPSIYAVPYDADSLRRHAESLNDKARKAYSRDKDVARELAYAAACIIASVDEAERLRAGLKKP
jgi:hypothetical protein